MTGPTDNDAHGDTPGGRPLRELRAERLLTIRDLARLAGVAATTIYEVEEGTRPPGRRVIRRIAAALELEPADVAEFRPRPPLAEADADAVAARLEAMGYPRVLALRIAGQSLVSVATPPPD